MFVAVGNSSLDGWTSPKGQEHFFTEEQRWVVLSTWGERASAVLFLQATGQPGQETELYGPDELSKTTQGSPY